MKITKEEAIKKWKMLLDHKKEMEDRFRMNENINIYAQFG